MRSLKALALYLSLAAASPAAEWSNLHDKGIEDIKRRDFNAAAGHFRQAMPLAETPSERAVSANDLGITLHQLNSEPEARMHLQSAFRICQASPGQEARLA